jgi:hypothetical protein
MTTPLEAVSDERLTELAKGYETWANTNSAQPQIDRDTASALRELIALRANGVKVKAAIKPLEWKPSIEGHASGQWFASSLLGEYYTYMHMPTGRAWLKGPDGVADFHDTIDLAKAAAQADYERRIRSALSVPDSPSPASGQIVAWIAEAENGLPPHKRGTTADPETAKYWAKTTAVRPLTYADTAPASGQVPVAWVTADILAAMKRGERVVPGWKYSADFCIPLYAHPPASKPAQGEGVTPERIMAGAKALADLEGSPVNNLMLIHAETVLTAALTSQEQS